MSSNFEDAVERAFGRTIEDFNRASKEASAIFWNEDTLRMTFFRYLCEQDIKIKRFFSEFEISLWGRNGENRLFPQRELRPFLLQNKP